LAAEARRDYYQILNVPRTATEQEIRSAFQKIAAEFHAAGKPRDIEGVERIRAIATAYRVLSDREKRARYDQSGRGFIGDSGNQLSGSGPDKLDEVLRRFEQLYENWDASVFFD
jgi:molecular chaperone DnaJ